MFSAVRAFLAPLRGFWLLWSRRDLRWYLVVPGLMQLVSLVALGVGAFFAFSPILNWVAGSAGTIVRVAVGTALAVALLGAVAALSGVVAGAAAAPILDGMTRRILQVRPAGGGALMYQLGHAAIFLGAQAVLGLGWLAGLVFPAVSGAFATASVAVGAYLSCVSAIDYPMGIAGDGFGARYSFFLKRPHVGLAFGASVLLVYLVPFTKAPVVAGACLVYSEAKRAP